MKYHEFTAPSDKSVKRVGRGIASGRGKTAGRGTKGQGARAGSSKRPGFEGGQNPLMQRLPKLPGFKSHRPKAVNVYTGQLEQLSEKTIDAQRLSELHLIENPFVSVKLLAGGALTKKLAVKLQAASAGAVAIVEQAGGTFEAVSRNQRPKTKAPKEQK